MTVKKANIDIRDSAKGCGVFLWEIADALGLSDVALIRRLRHELPDSQKDEILQAIEIISERKRGE